MIEPQSPAAPEVSAALPRWRRIATFAKVVALLLVLLLVALAAGSLWLRARMRASLPQVAGERSLPGLAAPVAVERDALGVPTIRAASRADAARALGFLHGQERFFQMDLMRRQAAGELAEIFGPGALPIDRANRVHRFRAVARQVMARIPPQERALIQAYADGVNAGLAALGAPPFEYLALRGAPAPWRAEDAILAVFAMFFQLNDPAGRRESDLGLMHDLLPAPLFDFLAPRGTEWDAPVVGEAFPTPPIPGPEVYDLRKSPPPAPPGSARLTAPARRQEDGLAAAAGSNNWAVDGAHTADGHALLANDMHLGIGVPNIWYRASIVRPDGQGGEARATGVTLPGTPALVVGSNGHVAWGFTNSYGDWTDLVILETDPQDPEVYRTPTGPQRFTKVTETIHVKGGKDSTREVRETIWGPVVDEDWRRRPRAYAWTAHHPEAVNLGLLDLETAQSLDAAMAVANRSGAPPQNFVVADAAGHIGWTVLGIVPRRVGFDGRLPTSWADGTRRWDGWLAPAEVPRIVDPPAGRIWTANARVVDGERLALLGDGGYDLGARARQIRDDLLALPKATPRDLLGVQLDDRALFLARWRQLLLSTLTPQALDGHPRRRELRRLVETTWAGRAAVDSVAFRAVRGFRAILGEQVFAALTAPCKAADDDFAGGMTPQHEGPLWRLVTERPPHLLDPRFHTWDEQLLAAVDALLDGYEKQGIPLARATWGQRNTTRIQHPLAQALPFVGRWLNVPSRQLPGDQNMPRVQSPAFGASERMVVSPGHEEAGFFEMPVGQSGNPLSPHYRDEEKAWEEGAATPFLPGPAVSVLRLRP